MWSNEWKGISKKSFGGYSIWNKVICMNNLKKLFKMNQSNFFKLCINNYFLKRIPTTVMLMTFESSLSHPFIITLYSPGGKALRNTTPEIDKFIAFNSPNRSQNFIKNIDRVVDLNESTISLIKGTDFAISRTLHHWIFSISNFLSNWSEYPWRLAISILN